jgi:aminoglycoside 6'-N-acetyltransferase
MDPAAASDQPIGSYARVGFRAVGVIWQYGRGGNGRFPDGLLTDLLRGELAGDR